MSSSYLGPNITYECYMVGIKDNTISFYVTVDAPNIYDARRIVEAKYNDARISGTPRKIAARR